MTARANCFSGTRLVTNAALAGQRKVRAAPMTSEADVNPADVAIAIAEHSVRPRLGDRQHERRDEDDFFPAERVREMSGGNRAENHRNHQRQADKRQGQRRVRALVKFPVNRHHEHLLAERRHEASDEIARKIRVSQNGVGAFACSSKRFGGRGGVVPARRADFPVIPGRA